MSPGLLASFAGVFTKMPAGVGGWASTRSGERKIRRGRSGESKEGININLGEERFYLVFCCSVWKELEGLVLKKQRVTVFCVSFSVFN